MHFKNLNKLNSKQLKGYSLSGLKLIFFQRACFMRINEIYKSMTCALLLQQQQSQDTLLRSAI